MVFNGEQALFIRDSGSLSILSKKKKKLIRYTWGLKFIFVEVLKNILKSTDFDFQSVSKAHVFFSDSN